MSGITVMPTGPTSGGGGGGGTSQAGSGNGRAGTAIPSKPEGRDPDYLIAGETILVNGKEYVVQQGDTLSSIAAKHGTTWQAIAKENKMDMSLAGQNGPNGAWFVTNGGPTMPPGSATTQPPTDDPYKAKGPNGEYTQAQAKPLLDKVDQLEKAGAISPERAAALKAMLNELGSGKLSKEDQKELSSQMQALREVEAQAKQTKAGPLTSELVQQLNGSITQALNAGRIDQATAASLRSVLNAAQSGQILKPDQMKLLNEFITKEGLMNRSQMAGPLTNDNINALLGTVGRAETAGRIDGAQARELKNILTAAQSGQTLTKDQMEKLDAFLTKERSYRDQNL
jgi:murein DD-endopeptidase MepM/ murein hydrolase activator NlpD